jgi:glucose/arabinose dehydrogenase
MSGKSAKVFIFFTLIAATAALLAGVTFYYFFLEKNSVTTISQIESNNSLPLLLPAGFRAGIYAAKLPGARVMIFGPDGHLWVSQTSEGRVVSLIDRDGDGFAEQTLPMITGLNKPHGLANRCEEYFCQLYVAEEDKVSVYEYDLMTKTLRGKRVILELPSGGGHYTRSLLLRPYPHQDDLLIAVGSSCNVCVERDSRRAAVLAYNLKTGEVRPFATGLRNSVFMAIQPVTGEVWATEMGRDWLGDDLPPDEINILKEGGNYGWPICYGQNVPDLDFNQGAFTEKLCAEPFELPSHIDIPAHSAPLGLDFFPEEGWPEDFWYNALVAYHGSWNRSKPTGYKVVRFKLTADGRYLGEDDFVTGFWRNGEAWGRPAGILISPGGVIYISDDKAGAVYRIVKDLN